MGGRGEGEEVRREGRLERLIPRKGRRRKKGEGGACL